MVAVFSADAAKMTPSPCTFITRTTEKAAYLGNIPSKIAKRSAPVAMRYITAKFLPK
jgi:hypothetical protein